MKNLINKNSILILVDVQEKLVPMVFNFKKVIKNILKLIEFAKIAKLPILIVEQKNLGKTIEKIRSRLSLFRPVQKVEFNCFANKVFSQKLKRINKNNLILAGIETHICILQTALSAPKKYKVFVVSDAVSSRNPKDHEMAIERLKLAGKIITTTETLIFEICKKANIKIFKEALKIIKS